MQELFNTYNDDLEEIKNKQWQRTPITEIKETSEEVNRVDEAENR